MRPGTQQAGDAHDLAGIQVKRNVLQGVAGVQLVHAQQWFPAGVRRKNIGLLGNALPRHLVDQPRVVVFAALALADVAPVAHDHDALGNLQHFVELVGDKEKGNAALLQFVDDGKKRPDLALGEGAGRLIHDDELRVLAQRLGDRDQLLGGDRHIFDAVRSRATARRSAPARPGRRCAHCAN